MLIYQTPSTWPKHNTILSANMPDILQHSLEFYMPVQVSGFLNIPVANFCPPTFYLMLQHNAMLESLCISLRLAQYCVQKIINVS